MTKDEALKLALDWYDSGSEVREEFQEMIESILAQPEQEPVKMVAYNCTCGRTMKFESVHGVVAPQRTEQNFCPRCGKRTQDIHTCTPPQENT